MLLTLTQSLAALTKEVQGLKICKIITVNIQITQKNYQYLGMDYPFGRNRDGDSNTAGHMDQFFIKERPTNKRSRAKMMSLIINIKWTGPQYGSKDYINEKVGV